MKIDHNHQYKTNTRFRSLGSCWPSFVVGVPRPLVWPLSSGDNIGVVSLVFCCFVRCVLFLRPQFGLYSSLAYIHFCNGDNTVVFSSLLLMHFFLKIMVSNTPSRQGQNQNFCEGDYISEAEARLYILSIFQNHGRRPPLLGLLGSILASRQTSIQLWNIQSGIYSSLTFLFLQKIHRIHTYNANSIFTN